MSLEEELNETNEYYLTHNIACVHKKTYTSSNCKSGLPRSKSSQW
ncbi:Holliday junction resolvase RecU [Bacillus paranthracis]